MSTVKYSLAILVLLSLLARGVQAEIVAFTTTLSKEYLIVSKSIPNGTTAVSITTTGNTLGHVVNLAPSAVALPAGISSPVTTDPTYDGDVALIDSDGTANYQDLDQYGDPDQGTVFKSTSLTQSNSQFDNGDSLPAQNLQNFATNRGIEEFAPSGSSTTTQNVNTFATEINDARSALMTMQSMTADVTIPTTSGVINSDTTVTLPNDGANIVKFTGIGGVDVEVNSANLVIQAPATATPGDRQAIVFVPDDANLKTSNGNIVVGQNMGLMDVVFVSLRSDNASHFNFSNTVLNGVAFWDMFRSVEATSDPSEHVWNNVTGCTQLIGDKINLSSEIHLSNCGFRGVSEPIPEPSVFLFLTFVASGMLCYRRGPR